ncbi:MAG: DUF4116 domain-containing protein, partial [Marinicaulis sp.]|nr:DUF4116 domain-containing protein [Marinicaulis sp.]
KEVVLAAVKQDGSVLYYADDKFKKDKKIVLIAVHRDFAARPLNRFCLYCPLEYRWLAQPRFHRRLRTCGHPTQGRHQHRLRLYGGAARLQHRYGLDHADRS